MISHQSRHFSQPSHVPLYLLYIRRLLPPSLLFLSLLSLHSCFVSNQFQSCSQSSLQPQAQSQPTIVSSQRSQSSQLLSDRQVLPQLHHSFSPGSCAHFSAQLQNVNRTACYTMSSTKLSQWGQQLATGYHITCAQPHTWLCALSRPLWLQKSATICPAAGYRPCMAPSTEHWPYKQLSENHFLVGPIQLSN